MTELYPSITLTPWKPQPTNVPHNWMALAEELHQQAKGALNEYVLGVKYDDQRVGSLLRSWGLPWTAVIAGYLWEYSEEYIRRAGLNDIDQILNHLRETKLYSQHIEDDNLPPLLTPPYSDLGALLIAVAIYYVTLQKLQEQSHEQPLTEEMQSQVQSIGLTLLNIVKRLGIWDCKRDIEDLTEQLRSPLEFARKRQEHKHILQQDAQMLEDTRQLLMQAFYKITNQPIMVVLNLCGIAGLKRREQDAHTTATSQKTQLTGFDLVTFDVLVPSVQACYAAFGALGQLGIIQDRVTDQIANPKPNGCSHIALGLILKPQDSYIADLTCLETPSGTCQVQISTRLMQAIVRYGCLYPRCYQLYMSKPSEEETELFSTEQFWNSKEGKVFLAIKKSLHSVQTQPNMKTSIVVYDKNRRPISLSKGATALDFAFALNTSIGEHAVEAFINNRKAPLYRVLDAGDIVEIRTSQQVQLLNETYAITPEAQKHIQEVLIQDHRDPKGYDLIRQALERSNYMLVQEDIEHELHLLLGQHKLGTTQDFLGRLDQKSESPYTPNWVAQEMMKQIAERNEVASLEKPGQVHVPVVDTSLITGRKHTYQQRPCRICKPAYPRDIKIVGHLNKRSNDLVVHKESCPHISPHTLGQQSQLLPMIWQLQPPTFKVGFFVTAHDRKALLLNITELLTKYHCNMSYINGEVLKFGMANFRFTIESHSDTQVLTIWQELTKIESIMHVKINAATTSQYVYERLQKLRTQSAKLPDKTSSELIWEETLATLQRRSPILKNPFDISRPATAKMFFGRTMETKTMQRELCDGEYGKALILYGPRRSGKSSICKNFLERYARPPFWYVLFSLQSAANQNEETILTHLTREVCREFHEQLQKPAPNPDDYTDNDPQIRFKHIVQDCVNQFPDTRLILVLDEFGGALESYINQTLEYRFFSYWKDLMNDIPHLSLVLVVPTCAHQLLISEEFSHAFSFAEYLPVTFLDNESAKRLLVDPLRDQQIGLHPNTATFAARLTGDNPYYMTMLGQQLIHQLNREPRKQVITPDDIHLAVDQIIEAGFNHNFVFHKQELQNATELRILKKFVEMTGYTTQPVLSLKKIAMGLGLPSAATRQHLERLRNGLIIEEHASSENRRFAANPYYSFKIELVRLWLDRNRWFFTESA